MAKTAYDTYAKAIKDYNADLQAQGEKNLTETTNSLKEFQRTSQNAFNAWFAEMKGLLDTDVAGKLANTADSHEQRIELLEYMTVHNDFFAPLKDDDGRTVIDDDGNAIMVDWKYAYR